MSEITKEQYLQKKQAQIASNPNRWNPYFQQASMKVPEERALIRFIPHANLTEEDLEELRELETGKEKYIPKEQMERLVFLEIAKPLSYSGIKDVFRSVGHFTYRLIEGGKRPDGWYPLSDNFFKRR